MKKQMNKDIKQYYTIIIGVIIKKIKCLLNKWPTNLTTNFGRANLMASLRKEVNYKI